MSEKDIGSKLKIDDRPSYIMDGNHRLAIALELKLDLVPVRFLHANDIKSIKVCFRSNT